MRIKGFITLLVFLSATFVLNAQVAGVGPILKSYVNYQSESPVEKVYIKTDREAYWPGDTLWFSAFLVDGHIHQASPLSRLLYVDLIHQNGSILSTTPIFPGENGISGSQFSLSDTLSPGTYRMRGYTNYMRNFDSNYFFDKPVTVLDSEKDYSFFEKTDDFPTINLGVYPEGGTLIAGIEKRVAIEVVDQYGDPIEGEGIVVDQYGEEVIDFNTEFEGKGTFVFTPKAAKDYFIQFWHDNVMFSTAFPQVETVGYSMSVIYNYDRVYVVVQGSQNIDFLNSSLLTHSRGIVFAASHLTREQDFFFASFARDELPLGVVSFTFFDPNRKPRCERLLLNNENDNSPELALNVLNESIGKRDELVASLNLESVKRRNNGAVSITVLPANEYKEADNDILSYLLLSSDLPGDIRDPKQYFDKSDRDLIVKQDLLMLTNGWRRFNWNDVMASNYREIDFMPEQGFTIEGKISGYVFRNKDKRSKVSLTFLEDVDVELQKDADEDGYFRFDGLEIYDEATAVVRTLPNKKNKVVNENTYIELIDRESAQVSEKTFKSLVLNPQQAFSVNMKKEKMDKIERAYGDNVVMLEEMTVESKQFEDLPFQTGYNQPDFRIYPDSMPGSENAQSVYDFINRSSIPGVKVVGIAPEQEITLRDSASGRQRINYLFDGAQVNKDVLRNMNPNQVAMIDVLKEERSALYAASLTIAVYTKNKLYGSSYFDIVDPRGWAMLEIAGFEAPREFYTPLHTSSKVRPDYRATQYWNPEVAITENEGKFSFTTSDEIGEFIIVAEGITETGYPVVATQSYTVE